jgi:hypothetical protein
VEEFDSWIDPDPLEVADADFLASEATGWLFEGVD